MFNQKFKIMKTLDFVRTPGGSIAFITQMSTYQNKENKIIHKYNIEFLGEENSAHEKHAWWSENELKVIDNLPSLLARNFV